MRPGLLAPKAHSGPRSGSACGNELASDVIIIGGGFCGTLTAVNLLRESTRPLRLLMIEAVPWRWHRGVAYSTERSCHLLNVRAGGMSALPHDDAHFLRWARARKAELARRYGVTEVEAGSFLPRGCYGDYLCDLMAAAESGSEGKLIRIEGEAVDLEADAVVLADGRRFSARHIVLATGNRPPLVPAPLADALASGRVVSDPWAAKGGSLAIAAEADVLVVGSGLTAVDVLLDLAAGQHKGRLIVLSRHGLWPKPHMEPAQRSVPVVLPVSPLGPLGWLRWLRAHSRGRGDAGAVELIDALRSVADTIWAGWSVVERHRFLRHLRRYWEIYRHRIAARSQAVLESLQASGRLTQFAGRIVGCRVGTDTLEVDVSLKDGADLGWLRVHRIVNCTGSGEPHGEHSPLFANLHRRGVLRPESSGMGFACTDGGRLLTADGALSARLWTLGVTRRGGSWESTAVPELRRQAADLAQRLAAELASRPAPLR